VASVNKTYFAGEYDWVGQKGGDSLAAFFEKIEQSPVAGGDMFWSLFGHRVPDCNVRVLSSFFFFLSFPFSLDSVLSALASATAHMLTLTRLSWAIAMVSRCSMATRRIRKISTAGYNS